MIKNLAKYAELEFAQTCEAYGARAQRVDEDVNGWDYLVEFPPEKASGPIDTSPPSKKAYVQIKSTERKKPSCRVKLSNALNAAISLQPWFVVLIQLEHGQLKTYAIHIWEDMIRRTLESARRAENNNKPLHQVSMEILFTTSNQQSNNLLPWMLDQINNVGDSYEAEKAYLNKNLGYEGGYGIGKMIISAESANEIERNFLGIGNGLVLDSLTYSPSRFGIPSEKHSIQAGSGIAYIKPHPISNCEIHLRSSCSSEKLVFSGKAYLLGAPILPINETRMRFSFDFFEVIDSSSNEKPDFAFSLQEDLRRSLHVMKNIVRLLSWFDCNPICAQIWLNGNKFCDGDLNISISNGFINFEELIKCFSFLNSLAGPLLEKEIEFSLNDIKENYEALFFARNYAEAPNLTISLKHTSDNLEGVSAVVYYLKIHISEWLFCSIIERVVKDDIVVEGMRKLICGPPKCVDGYVLNNSNGSECNMIINDFERYVLRRKALDRLLVLGDIDHIRKYIQEINKEEKASE